MWKSHRLRFALPCSLALTLSVHAAAPNPISVAIFDAMSCKMAALEMSLASSADDVQKAHSMLLDAHNKLDEPQRYLEKISFNAILWNVVQGKKPRIPNR